MAEGIDCQVNAWARNIKVSMLAGTFPFYVKLSLKLQVHFHFPLKCKQSNRRVCGVYTPLNTQRYTGFGNNIHFLPQEKRECLLLDYSGRKAVIQLMIILSGLCVYKSDASTGIQRK
jgi:hypothetical protein